MGVRKGRARAMRYVMRVQVGTRIYYVLGDRIEDEVLSVMIRVKTN